MPQSLLREARVTLPCCECHYEGLNNNGPDNDHLYMLAKEVGVDKSEIIRRGYLNHPLPRGDVYLICKPWPYPLTRMDKDCLEKVCRATSEAGLSGEWFRLDDNSAGYVKYVFTTHDRRCDTDSMRRCPFPDEVYCVLDVERPYANAFFRRMNHNEQLKHKVMAYISMDSLEGWAYWNSGFIQTPKGTLQFFFGDEVPSEKIERLQKAMIRELR